MTNPKLEGLPVHGYQPQDPLLTKSDAAQLKRELGLPEDSE